MSDGAVVWFVLISTVIGSCAIVGVSVLDHIHGLLRDILEELRKR